MKMIGSRFSQSSWALCEFDQSCQKTTIGIFRYFQYIFVLIVLHYWNQTWSRCNEVQGLFEKLLMKGIPDTCFSVKRGIKLIFLSFMIRGIKYITFLFLHPFTRFRKNSLFSDWTLRDKIECQGRSRRFPGIIRVCWRKTFIEA